MFQIHPQFISVLDRLQSYRLFQTLECQRLTRSQTCWTGGIQYHLAWPCLLLPGLHKPPTSVTKELLWIQLSKWLFFLAHCFKNIYNTSPEKSFYHGRCEEWGFWKLCHWGSRQLWVPFCADQLGLVQLPSAKTWNTGSPEHWLHWPPPTWKIAC